MKNMNLHIQQAQQTTSQINYKQTLRHKFLLETKKGIFSDKSINPSEDITIINIYTHLKTETQNA